jgi:threonine/homoserine/homoserine lactone efflux protein
MSFDLALLAQAALIGLSIAAPVGPIALLIVQRTLAEGLAVGLACGLGTAVADALYALLAAFGLVAASGLLQEISWWVGLAGAAFLAWLGAKILLSRPAATAAARAEARAGDGRLLGAFLTTTLLTLSNPLTIVSFLAVFASLGVAASGAPGAATTVVLGVLLGSLAWQWGLALAAGLARRWMAAGLLVWINRASGLFLLGFAGWLLWRAAARV